MEKRTIIIAAFLCCGKVDLYHSNSKYSILDLDEVIEKREKDKISVNEILNINSIYLEKIEESIGKYDFILIPVKHSLLSLLVKNNLPKSEPKTHGL